MNEAASRRKLLLLAVFGASIALPATAMLLMASDAEAQQADQAAPPETAPKKKTKKTLRLRQNRKPSDRPLESKLCAASRPAGI